MKYNIEDFLSASPNRDESVADFDARLMSAVVKLSACAAKEPQSHYPFAAAVVRDADRVIVGQGLNSSQLKNDPTLHGEVVAIRDACANLGEQTVV